MRRDTRKISDGDRLDCGHVYNAPESLKRHGFGATGYAIRCIPGRPDFYLCGDCANAAEIKDLQTSDRFMGYLTALPGTPPSYSLNTWLGAKLATVTHFSMSRRRYGFGTPYTLYYFRATDVHGGKWYGTSPGPGMYARMRRAKGGKRGSSAAA